MFLIHTRTLLRPSFWIIKKKIQKHWSIWFDSCVLNSSPKSKLNKCQLIGDLVYFKQYNWSDWIDKLKFLKIPGIGKLHYFKYHAEKPKYVSVKACLIDVYIDMKLVDNFDILSGRVKYP